MQKSILLSLVSILSIILSVPVNALDCDGILRHGLRNIQVSKSTEASVATKYFNHCNKDFSSMSDEQMGSVEVEVFGYGGGGGSISRKQREERLGEWCKTNSSTAKSHKSAYEESQLIYGDAVAAWNNCNELSSQDVIITPFISPDALDVDFSLQYRGPTKSGVKFYGVKPKGFSCDVIVPGGDGTVDFDPKSPPEIGPEAISISCERDDPVTEKIGDQEYTVVPRGLITVKTASYPLQVFFPKEYIPSLPDQRADLLEKEVESLKASLEKANKVIDANAKQRDKIDSDISKKIKGVETKVGALGNSRGGKTFTINGPRIGGADAHTCPAGTFVSNIHASGSVGGKYGVDGISQIKFRCSPVR